MLLELLKENDAILDNRSSASSPNSLKVEKEKGMNLYPFSSYLAEYIFLFLSATLAKKALGTYEETPVLAKGEPPVTSTQASLP